MKKNYISLGITLFTIMTAVFITEVSPVAGAGGPPFKAGEIVVSGSPGPSLMGYTVVKYLPHADLTVVKVEKGKEFGTVQRLLNKGREAGLNYIYEASVIPNDLYYRTSDLQWNFKAVQSELAWDIGTGSGVTVAVLDTGLATEGPDGIHCVAPGIDIVNNDLDPQDGDGHGTHVSGTIAQNTGNSIGVAGLAYDACIMPVKVLDDTGSGTTADIADGISYAVANGAAVINMSLGINANYHVTHDAVLDPALDMAYANGVTVVCAAGNDGSKKNVSYPAIYPTTIAVGATEFANRVTRYSNKGEGLDIVAPGGNTSRDANRDGYLDGILQETKINGEWNYWFFQGTSMATPHVAAVAAMLISDQGPLTPSEVRNILTSSALDLNEAGYDSSSGYGLVQAYDALTYRDGVIDPGGNGTDNDADGWTIENGDCDDNDPHTYPGHQDSKGKWGHNGIDNDCNGKIDG